jgi:transcriptional regulator with XRE-family HTH domain
MDRSELADFLRRRRENLRPDDVGLPLRARRRTPGLRRDEVSALADMSTDYYTRLEQARGPNPSVPVLTGLARALRLTVDERDHLFLLAGQAPPSGRQGSQGHIGPGILHMLDQLTGAAAFVSTDLDEILVQNPLAKSLLGDAAEPAAKGSFTWRWFTDPASRHRYPPEDWAQHSRTYVDDIRATAARRAGDADVEDLVRRLRMASTEFETLWAEHTVAVHRSDRKRVIHPEVGLVDLLCEAMTTADHQRLVVLYPRPGTDAREKLELLSVIGSQNLSPR